MNNPNKPNYTITNIPATYYVLNVRSGQPARAWQPPTDVYETQDHVCVRIEIAGMKDGDFSINIQDNWLTVTGMRVDTTERRAFHQIEIPFGEFAVMVEIPAPIDIDQVKADYQQGFLKIIMPKAQTRHIKINEV